MTLACLTCEIRDFFNSDLARHNFNEFYFERLRPKEERGYEYSIQGYGSRF